MPLPLIRGVQGTLHRHSEFIPHLLQRAAAPSEGDSHTALHRALHPHRALAAIEAASCGDRLKSLSLESFDSSDLEGLQFGLFGPEP